MLGTQDNVIHAISTKAEGNMSFSFGDGEEVIANRGQFLKTYDLSLDDTAVMIVDHADHIAHVNEAQKGVGTRSTETAINADGLITDTPGVCLFLLTADCLPVALYDPVNEAIGLFHLGWQSTDLDLLHKALTQMHETFGTLARDLLVDIGPGIHRESYMKHDPPQRGREHWRKYLTETDDGYQIDIVGYNYDAVRTAGVPALNIAVSECDTAQDPDYFSHYNAARGKEADGRFATILMLNQPT